MEGEVLKRRLWLVGRVNRMSGMFSGGKGRGKHFLRGGVEDEEEVELIRGGEGFFLRGGFLMELFLCKVGFVGGWFCWRRRSCCRSLRGAPLWR